MQWCICCDVRPHVRLSSSPLTVNTRDAMFVVHSLAGAYTEWCGAVYGHCATALDNFHFTFLNENEGGEAPDEIISEKGADTSE